MTQNDAPPAEFSRPVDLDRVGDRSSAFELDASAPERTALAQRFGLVSLDKLEAKVTLRWTQARLVLRLDGTLIADLTQACVLTLDPLPQHIGRAFTVLYAADSATDEVVITSSDDEEAAEPLPDGQLDIGEAVAQELALALDPYARTPGAAVDSLDRPLTLPERAAERPDNPFAALAKLRKKDS